MMEILSLVQMVKLYNSNIQQIDIVVLTVQASCLQVDPFPFILIMTLRSHDPSAQQQNQKPLHPHAHPNP
jgi:hypothetical protein